LFPIWATYPVHCNLHFKINFTVLDELYKSRSSSFSCCCFYELGCLAFSDSEWTETLNPLRHFGRTPWTGYQLISCTEENNRENRWCTFLIMYYKFATNFIPLRFQ
jgi:hypothetical protein